MNGNQNERQTVAVVDGDGKLWWFRMEDATHWEGTTMEGGELFRVAGRWVMLAMLAEELGEPARFVDDEAALQWLTANGYAPPAELADCAERRRLR